MTKEGPHLHRETESPCHVRGLAEFIVRLLERYPGLSRAAALRLAGLPSERSTEPETTNPGDSMIELPRVVTLVDGSCHVSTASYRLAAVQVERVPPEALSARLASRHEVTTRLTAFVARMPPGTAVEMHWIGLPSLDPYFPGTVEIRLDVHGRADRLAASIELCLENSFRLMRHAAAFWPSAEFQPSLNAAMPPFVPCGCLRITRRRERIHLARPFEKAIRSNIGFAAESLPVGGGNSEAALSVRHTFPWIASGDDATALAQALLASPVPLWITVRLSPAGNCNCVGARMEADLAACEDFLAGQGGRESHLLQQTAALREVILERACLIREPALRTSVLLRAPGAPRIAAAVLIGQAISGDFSRNSARNPFFGGYCVRNSRPSRGLVSSRLTKRRLCRQQRRPAHSACPCSPVWIRTASPRVEMRRYPRYSLPGRSRERHLPRRKYSPRRHPTGSCRYRTTIEARVCPRHDWDRQVDSTEEHGAPGPASGSRRGCNRSAR